MAEPGDPHTPQDDDAPTPGAPADHDLDDHVGFASSAALTGRPRHTPEPEPAPEPEPEAEAEPELDFEPAPVREPLHRPQSEPTPGWAVETPHPDRTPPPVEGSMGLYAVYALILFAVPTLGVSALIGLLAVTGRELPADPLARGHFIYQQRTLWAGAVIALLGAILVVVNVGVFVLFLLAVWLLLRGALGVLRLKSGRPIDDPRHWLI